jgi:hypothetical protein
MMDELFTDRSLSQSGHAQIMVPYLLMNDDHLFGYFRWLARKSSDPSSQK